MRSRGIELSIIWFRFLFSFAPSLALFTEKSFQNRRNQSFDIGKVYTFWQN